MPAVQEILFDIIRQGLPVVGALSGLTWATADGVVRNRSQMVLRAMGGSMVGWGIGYAARMLILGIVDNASGEALPGSMASLGPQPLGWTEPGTMPNPTQHPEPFASPADLPMPQSVQGETVQMPKDIASVNEGPTATNLTSEEDVEEVINVQGNLDTLAYGNN